MKKEDFSTENSVSVKSFNEIEEWQYVFVIGFKNGVFYTDDITEDWTGEKLINNKDIELFTPEKQKEYYDKEFDFYFIFSEEDERQEFIDENELEPQEF